jgi:A/G-specific adenine glycosylase
LAICRKTDFFGADLVVRTSVRTRRFATKLLDWYDRNGRDLPWRRRGKSNAKALDPYAVLVSEFMLQQTQVSTVIPYFHEFMRRFPTVRALAAKSEQNVLRAWQGLGYYSRARNLREAAARIVTDFAGKVPGTVEQLQILPGIGRYTAGAIASLAYGARAPILDGNVSRVLCRLNLIRRDPRESGVKEMLWKLAEEILPKARVGDFNSALMDLGATVCTPRAPKCAVCPVKGFCRAEAAGAAERIPRPRAVKATPVVVRWTFCIANKSRWLIEQRPVPGRWAGLWQFVTVEGEGGRPDLRRVSERLGFQITDLKALGRVRHALSHRRYIFEVFRGRAAGGGDWGARKWVRTGELSRYPLPRVHEKIAAMLRDSPRFV